MSQSCHEASAEGEGFEGLPERTIGPAATEKDPLPLTTERRALFLAAQHCQGGHSTAGSEIAELLGVPFPLRMTSLIAKLRLHGENPALFYPWLRKMHGSGQHPFFTAAEIEAAAVAPEEASPRQVAPPIREDLLPNPPKADSQEGNGPSVARVDMTPQSGASDGQRKSEGGAGG